MSFAELIPEGLHPSTEEADVLLELTYLVTAADGRLADEELAAFAVLAARLRDKPALEAAEIDELLGRFAGAVEWSEIEERVTVLAAKLPVDMRAVAYRLALGIAFVDCDPSPEEDRLHKLLGEKLGLSTDRRAAIARQVTIDGGRARAPTPK